MQAGIRTQTPVRKSITGKITVLKVQSIRVHGIGNLTCRITTTSPKPALRGFTLGMKAKITCKSGVLSAIARASALQPSPVTIMPSGTVTAPKSEPQPDPAVTTPGTGGVKTAPSIAGNGTITLLSGGTIEFNNSISCLLGSNSPSVAAYKVGSKVSYTCTGGELQTIGASEAT